MNPLKCLFILAFIFSVSAISQIKKPVREYSGQTIWDITKISEQEMDIGFWALMVAKEYDKSIDVQKYLDQLDASALEIHRMLANRMSDGDKTASMITFLYKAGVWNNNNPFKYDLDDPLGAKLENQLLCTYLDTRKGNCISMPTLYLALIERVDPTLFANGVYAPLHLFCRIKDRQTGDIWNLETTDEGHSASNKWYVDKLHISSKGVEKGIYLRSLSKKEYLAELITTLVYKCRDEKNWAKGLKYTELALKLNPLSIENIVQKSSLTAWLVSELDEKGKKGSVLTTQEEESRKKYMDESKNYWTKAIELGWVREKPEDREKYLQDIQKEKAKRNNQ